ncbi:unnamed protein product [Cylindrotheca closterium]|uniref:Glycosyl transferase family 25 domain-containing protein n=1 Tax=Cylindrotheca closterium TaxID=2856 RepID=A0AAD2JPI5_9STRA|nr:unnamed protein product [Cylindrotheca closterium]
MKKCSTLLQTLAVILSLLIPSTNGQRFNVINLARDTDRWERVKVELMKEFDLEKIHRMEGVHGKSLTSQERHENASLGARLFCTEGTIGCYMSHRKFWEQVVEGDEPYQIVFEDDVVLTDDFQEQVKARIEELKGAVGAENWDVLMLGALGCVNPNPRKYGSYVIPAFVSGGCRKPRKITENIHIPMRPFGTHAYILSKRGAKKLLDRSWRATYHVDCVIWGMRDLDLYIAHPLLVYQDSSPSTVGAITSGPETWIPSSIQMDDYTKMRLEWVWNEAVIRIPAINLIITQGRYLLIGIFGSIFGAFRHKKAPKFLPKFLSMYFIFIVSFNRIINRPRGR